MDHPKDHSLFGLGLPGLGIVYEFASEKRAQTQHKHRPNMFFFRDITDIKLTKIVSF